MQVNYSTIILICITLTLCLASCQAPKENNTEEVSFTVINAVDREDFVLEIPLTKIKEKNNDLDFENLSVQMSEENIPFEIDQISVSLLCLIPETKAGKDYELTIKTKSLDEPNFTIKKRTQAELSHKVGGEFQNRKYIGGEFKNVHELKVPQEHTDHSYFIRYEGPGWESDKVGYRFYLDWRNGIDVFGKKTPEMVLLGVGQDGFDSYHEPAGWGMDILKVGPSLGLGSIATWEDGKARRVDATDSLYVDIAQDGALRSTIKTNYYGWDIQNGKTDLLSTISIDAGSRMSKIELIASNGINNFCTGLIKSDKAPLKVSDQTKKFSYIASYGQQSLADDMLGIAVIFPTEQLQTITEDANSHVVVLNPENSKEISYYILAAWEQEPDGIKDEAAFYNYLAHQIDLLSKPAKIE